MTQRNNFSPTVLRGEGDTLWLVQKLQDVPKTVYQFFRPVPNSFLLLSSNKSNFEGIKERSFDEVIVKGENIAFCVVDLVFAQIE